MWLKTKVLNPKAFNYHNEIRGFDFISVSFKILLKIHNFANVRRLVGK